MKSTKNKAWYKTLRYDENNCRVCDNTRNHDGYVRVNGCSVGHKRLIMLHVLRWKLHIGDIPNGMEINHKCGNRGCCNLDHLELICGSAHATLTNVSRVGYVMVRKSDQQVSEMYRRIKYGGEYINQLCKEFNIKRSTLSSIVNKRSRCGVTDLVDKEFN
jgi:hypothetical protein